jgi:regulation of enolase protein 1 (concanavalin A-like superfamily)
VQEGVFEPSPDHIDLWQETLARLSRYNGPKYFKESDEEFIYREKVVKTIRDWLGKTSILFKIFYRFRLTCTRHCEGVMYLLEVIARHTRAL